ncbi:MAG: hypothetical protein NZO58_14545 [Gemmataceae bacterium]|nr:hypothetical protein [Gemmataceae bacterium]
MLTGIALAVLAVWIALEWQRSWLPLTVFILAGLSMLAGVVALMVQNYGEPSPAEEHADERPLQVYRQTSFAIDKEMIHRLAGALAVLKQRIRDHGWHADFALSQQYYDLGEKALADGDLREAFRAHCRALLVLMEAIHQQRGKEEAFQPLWD